MKTVYLSGPMSGLPSFNIPAFDAAARELRAVEYNVISPAELDDPAYRDLCLLCHNGSMDELCDLCYAAKVPVDSWGDLLARDIKLITSGTIEGIVCLPGWTRSKGARGETFFGRLMGIPLFLYPSLRDVNVDEIQWAHGLPRNVEGVNLSEGEVVNWLGRQPIDTVREGDTLEKGKVYQAPLDTAESVQANAELYEDYPGQKTEVEQARGAFKSFSPLPPPRDWTKPPESDILTTPEVKRRAAAMGLPVRKVDPKTGGEKDVKDEVEGDLCPRALIELAKVCGFGRRKYSRANYLRGYEWSSSYDAMQRHLKAFWAGEEINDESGLHHLAHGAWHALALLAFTIRKVGTDDRI